MATAVAPPPVAIPRLHPHCTSSAPPLTPDTGPPPCPERPEAPPPKRPRPQHPAPLFPLPLSCLLSLWMGTLSPLCEPHITNWSPLTFNRRMEKKKRTQTQVMNGNGNLVVTYNFILLLVDVPLPASCFYSGTQISLPNVFFFFFFGVQSVA